MNMNTWHARLWQQFGHIVWAVIFFGSVAYFALHVSNQTTDTREKLDAVAAPAPGSAEAANAMIPAYLGQLLSVVDVPVVKGDTATVHARILDQSCDLTLTKNPAANESGWVVAKQNCKKL